MPLGEASSAHLEKPAVGTHGNAFGRSQQCPGINDIQQCDLLLPNLYHCVIESGDELLSLFLRLLLGDVAIPIHQDSVLGR